MKALLMLTMHLSTLPFVDLVDFRVILIHRPFSFFKKILTGKLLIEVAPDIKE
jgi:hypothetical protein